MAPFFVLDFIGVLFAGRGGCRDNELEQLHGACSVAEHRIPAIVDTAASRAAELNCTVKHTSWSCKHCAENNKEFVVYTYWNV